MAVKMAVETAVEMTPGAIPLVFDGRGKMYLHTGWEKFVRSHDLQAECVLTFCYQGGEEMSVKVSDDTSCRQHYHSNDGEYDN
ncbi:hypothetical protein QYE76_026124 [Lolium multiflorum]|uniref:TF-B3 domain-containing protein n=1 Tax=Lolium multiflorum TaxID=4521 RepID=A0AAD8RI19_LOLMU|nr:hypothetical protein QYE76_026124 [Lolium multiflorum]